MPDYWGKGENTMAQISVIIPCYNVAPYIDRCLTSIVSQTIGINSLEIICVDDASTDDTWQHLQKWEQDYPKQVLLVHCDGNGNSGMARNIGLQYAQAKWIGFIDSDDWIEPDYFEKLLEAAEQRSCDVVVCQKKRDFSRALAFFEKRETGRESRLMVIDTIEKRKLFLYFQSAGYGAPGKLIRKALLIDNQLLFPENLAYEDCCWGSILHFYVKRVYILEENLYHYFVNKSSIVLRKDAGYHVDYLTIQCMKWEEWERRGFLAVYREELEYEFLSSCYLAFMKIIFLRYTKPSYSLYLLAKEITLSHVPDHQQNKYIKEGLTEFYQVLLDSLHLPMNKSQFLQMAEYARECMEIIKPEYCS